MRTLLRGIAFLVALALWGCGTETPSGPGGLPLDVEAPRGVLRRPYQLDLAVATSVAGATWRLLEGSLPPGVQIEPSGLVRGVPERAGYYSSKLAASRPGGSTVVADLTLEIVGGTRVEIRTAGWWRGDVSINGVTVCRSRRGLRSGPCSYFDPEGRAVELVPAADPGGTFGGWWEGCRGAGPCAVEPGDTARVVAVFGNSGAAGFNIEFLGTESYPEWVIDAVDRAATRWERMLDDLPSVTLTDPVRCGGREELLTHPIDDLALILDVTEFGGGVGTACETGVVGRPSPAGVITVGAPAMNGERLFDIMSHEIGHTLGIGGSPAWYALATGVDGPTPRFHGEQAVREFRNLGGNASSGVPLDQGIHWSADAFGAEAMATTVGPISVVTLGALADLGYSVRMGAAEPFLLPAPAVAR